MRFDHKAYGDRIKRLRRGKGLTQEQLAEKLCVSRTYIGKIEKGSQVGPIELAAELAVLFDVPLASSAGQRMSGKQSKAGPAVGDRVLV